VGAYAEHLVCSNGMTSDAYFARFVFRHHQGNINWDEATQNAFLAVMSGSRGKLTRFAGLLNRLKQKDLTVPDLAEIRKSHLTELASGMWGKVVDQFLTGRTHNGFALLDACTRVFWHNEKQSYADFRNNSYATDALVQYAERLRN